MYPSRLNAFRLVTIVWLCFPMCQPVWGYGWTGHWWVMEAAWPSLSAGLCDGLPNQHAFTPGALDLTRQEIALAAGLGTVVSDIGYITQGTGKAPLQTDVMGPASRASGLVALNLHQPLP